jgi:hypothetical protein
VLGFVPATRFPAGFSGKVTPDDFKLGESARVPPNVAVTNRNYMNLLELPMLFYVVCIVLYVTAGASTTTTALAWAFVVLRIAHSLIHLTYNHVIHRLTVFALSSTVLTVLWVLAAHHLVANPLA